MTLFVVVMTKQQQPCHARRYHPRKSFSSAAHRQLQPERPRLYPRWIARGLLLSLVTVLLRNTRGSLLPCEYFACHGFQHTVVLHACFFDVVYGEFVEIFPTTRTRVLRRESTSGLCQRLLCAKVLNNNGVKLFDDFPRSFFPFFAWHRSFILALNLSQFWPLAAMPVDASKCILVYGRDGPCAFFLLLLLFCLFGFFFSLWQRWAMQVFFIFIFFFYFLSNQYF